MDDLGKDDAPYAEEGQGKIGHTEALRVGRRVILLKSEYVILGTWLERSEAATSGKI